jgi:uncharacterized membrane protein
MGIRTLVITVFAAAIAALTLFFRIPMPATGGYLNLGDILIIFAGLRLGPSVGAGAGALGSVAADLIGGYAAFVPITLLAKGLEGWLPGVVAHRSTSAGRTLLGASLGAVAMVVGYFVGQSLMPGIGKEIAIAGLPGDVIQGLAGVVGGCGLYRSVDAAFRTK